MEFRKRTNYWIVLTVIVSLVITGCVPIDAGGSSRMSEPRSYDFTDIDTLRSINTELKGAKNPERLKTLIEKVRDYDLRGQLYAELQKKNFNEMKKMVVGKIKALSGDAVRVPIEKTAISYREAGKFWGIRLENESIKPPSKDFSMTCIGTTAFLEKSIDCLFVHQLASKQKETGGLDYFDIHSELKQAFHTGFREGYEDRTSDLVFGPHAQLAGGLIGHDIAVEYVSIINAFEKDWVKTLRQSINIFITLISEGSQADRVEFIGNFVAIYKEKYLKTVERKKEMMPMTSAGGTNIYINMSEVVSALDIPSDDDLKSEVYKQTFIVMGHELGRKLRHNLMKREEMIDLLRRSKSVFSEAPKIKFNEALTFTRDGFKDGYKDMGALDLFMNLIKAAGLVES